MSAPSSSTLRPASQPRDQLVLQVENVPLAGRLLTIEIFEVQNATSAKATGTPSSTIRSAPSTPTTPSNSARASGFRVAARDDVENEYSLFVSRQKAEYLYRAAYPMEATDSDVITSEAMANGILVHLNIVGNRQRDVGKLVCREPEPHIEKKTRILPVTTPPNKQRNPHLPSKRQDQRAVRVQKTSMRTMEAVARAMRRPDPNTNGGDENAGSEVESGKLDRKSSEASLLHRMAVADSKTIWKTELETNYEECDHPLPLIEEDDSYKTPEYTLAPSLSPVKRALPERKTKHKDLEERRQKGRQQRILIAQGVQEATPSALDRSIQAQDSYSNLAEESEHDIDSDASRRASMVTVSNAEKPISQPRASSAPRSSAVVGNAYALQNFTDSNTPEPEQFLRRKTLDTHRSVLRKDHWHDDIPGMGIEITDERPTLQTPPNKLDALLNTARHIMVANAVGASLQRASTSRLVSERKSNRTFTSPNLYSAALSASPLFSPKNEKHIIHEPVPTAQTPTTIDQSQLRDVVVKNSPRPRSKSISSERGGGQPILESISPIPPLTMLDLLQKEVDDRNSSEMVSSPNLSSRSKLEESRAEMQTILRPRSNSVGAEGVVRLAPLPISTSKLPIQEFLAPPEPQDTPNTAPECEVVPEKEISVSIPDSEVVLYPPNELIPEMNENIAVPPCEEMNTLSTMDKLSFEGIKDGIQGSASARLPAIDTNLVVDAQDRRPNTAKQPLPSTSEQDVVSPPTSRQVWEEPTNNPVISSDAPNEVDKEIFRTGSAVEANPTLTDHGDEMHEKQHVVVREDDFEAQPYSAMPQASNVKEKETAASNESSELVEMVTDVILDNQMNSPRPDEEDGEELKGVSSNPLHANNDDHLDQGNDRSEDAPADADALVECTAADSINNAELIVDDNDAVKDGVDTIDGGNASSFASNAAPVDVGGLLSRETDHQEPCSQHDENNDTQMLEPPVDDNDHDSVTFLVADSADKIQLSDDQQHFEGKATVLVGDVDSRVPDENYIHAVNNTLSYEERTSMKPDPKEMTISKADDRDQDFEKNMLYTKAKRVDASSEVAAPSHEAPDTKVKLMEQPGVSVTESIPSNANSATSQQKQPPVESIPEREKPSGTSRKKSLISTKTSGPSAGQAKTTSKTIGSRRKSTIAQLPEAQVVDQATLKRERRHTSEDVMADHLPRGRRRTSTLNPSNALPGLDSGAPGQTAANLSAEKSSGLTLRLNSKRELPSKPQQSKVAQGMTNYHKKWGKWMVGKNIIEKIGCLQLEDLVIADPKNEENLLKLGLRYARWSGTSMHAILLLEHAALLHKNATGTREYWFWLGSAHLDIFMRHRKYLPIARFHLSKSLRAFTSAFAYIESLADPMLLLRYAIGLFWHKGDGNLEKTRDIFHELFSQFVNFCDKDRPNLLFLQFQVLHRLKLYVDAIDCMIKILDLYEKPLQQAAPTDVLVLPSATTMAHFEVYNVADYRLMLMQCQQASGDYVAAAQSLASVLKLKNMQQEATLTDEEYFDLWFSLAEKSFHHEDYALALEYYPIALNFAKQSQVLAAIHYNLGLCFQSLGEDNKCVTEYKRARTANRHVSPLASLTELGTSYDERFALLLEKSVVQTIEEVRVELYGRAVRRLQRVFRQSRRNLSINLDNSNSGVPLPKMPSLSKRRLSIAAARNPPTLVKIEDASDEMEAKEEDNLPQKAAALDDNQAIKYEDSSLEIVERRHETFLARKQAAKEEMTELLTNPQYRGREASPSSRPNVRLKAATQLRSGLLSPEKDRLDARRNQSMEAFRQLGYVSSTMPWIEFWEKLLALASELFESRQTLYGSIARIRGRLPLVSDEVAFCALAECIGNVHEAAEKLHDASYERELTYVCAVIEVSKQLERDFPLKSIQLSLKPPDVSLPTISSITKADSIAGQALHSPVGTVASRGVVLPPYSPSRATSPSISKPKKHLRMNQMLDLHFQEHVQKQEAAIAITEATGGFVHPHQRTEKLMVLQNFRQTNNVLLNSQLAFGSEKAVT